MIELNVYMCGKCGYISTHPSRAVYHQKHSTSCSTEDAVIQGTATCNFPEPVLEERTKTKPGPKPFDYDTYFQGVIPSDEWDPRIEYLFETPGLLDRILSKGCLIVPSLFYAYLWGARAPKHFQSVVADSHGYVELHERNEEDGTFGYTRHTAKRDFTGKMLVSIFEFMTSIMEHSIPYRNPELLHKMREIHYTLTCEKSDSVTFLDIITRSDKYNQKRRTLHEVTTRHAKALLFNMTRELEAVQRRR